MMKIVVIFALFIVAAFAQQCLPANYATNIWGIPVVLDAPVEVQSGEFCNKNGNSAIQSCCDQATLKKFSEFWIQYRQSVQAAAVDFKNAAKDADASKLVYSALPLPPGTNVNALPSAYRDAIDNVVNAYKEFLSNGPAHFGLCLNGLGNYYQGLLCGFCSTNWQEIVDVSNNGNSYTVTFDLSTSTCDKLSEQCSPFVKSVFPVFQSIVNLMKAFLLPVDIDDIFPCADGDCPAFTCNSFVEGFSIPTGNFNFTDIATAAATGSARTVQSAIAMTRNPMNVKKFFSRQQGNVKQSNTYSNDGYDTFAVGANAGLSAGSNSGSSSSAFTAIPSIVAGLAAIALAL